MPIFLILSIVFVVWLGYEIRKHNKADATFSETFWKHEYEANFVRPKDISSLNYIIVPLDVLPFKDNAKESILEIQDAIRKLSEKKLLNLNGMSNTELKYQYGAKNLEELANFDQNYLVLLRSLNKWAYLLYEERFINDAKTILEYAISIKTDISGSYALLADIYASEGNYDEIDTLILQAQELKTLMKDSILQALKKHQKLQK